MKHKVFAILDSKAGFFSNPFLLAAEGLAVRSFTELANDPKSSINKYPSDFELFQLAEFDDVNGEFTSVGRKSFGLAVGYVRQVPPALAPAAVPLDPGVVDLPAALAHLGKNGGK